MTTFTPGEYRTLGGRTAVVTEAFGHRLFGRWEDDDGIWWAGVWHLDGKSGFLGVHDIIPPPPPVVVSDETVRSLYGALGWEGTAAWETWREALAAAICNHMAEQPR